MIGGYKGVGQGQVSRSWGQGQDHDWWSQGRRVKVGGQGQGIGHGVKSGGGLGSRSGVKVWERVKVLGSRSGSRY